MIEEKNNVTSNQNVDNVIRLPEQFNGEMYFYYWKAEKSMAQNYTLNRIPTPEDYYSFRDFEASVNSWFQEAKKVFSKTILPVPVSLFAKRPIIATKIQLNCNVKVLSP